MSPFKRRTNKKAKKKGAIVFQPKLGASFNCAVLDFSMYYPLIIIAHNLSKEIAPGDKSRKGLLPKVCEFLIKHRLQAKADEKKALKEFGPESDERKKAKSRNESSKFTLNSVFGVTGNERFRLYDPVVFESITAAGREGLQLIKSMTEQSGYEVIYGDTDSIYVVCGTYANATVFTKKLTGELNALFREKYSLTIDFDIKIEKWVSPVVFSKKRHKEEAGKKRYFYRVLVEDGVDLQAIGKDYVVIMGHAMVRRDASPLCKFVQKKVFESIAYERLSEIKPFLKDCYDKYMAGEFDLESIAARSTITMRFDDYTSPTVALRGAKYLNEHMNPSVPVVAGDTVRYVYVKRVDGGKGTDVISYVSEKDVDGRIVVDLETMFDKQIVAKTQDVLDDVGISWEEILGQTNILDYF